MSQRVHIAVQREVAHDQVQTDWQAAPQLLPGQTHSLAQRALTALASAWEWSFGVLMLIIGLAVVAAVPLVQVASLGYLLEVAGRIARTGRIRDGFIGVPQAARVGNVLVGSWLVLSPLRFVASLAASAELIDPGGPVARAWHVVTLALAALLIAHVLLACTRGGKFRYFLWPFGNPVWLMRRLRRGGYYTEARDAVWDFVLSLRLPYYFWLGSRGFVGSLAWLIIPVTLIGMGRKAALIGWLGGLALGLVVLYLPFLQVRFALENRLAAFFSVRAVRAHFQRAPWAFLIAFLVTLAFALPLYLLKIEMIPREVAWLLSVFFVVFIFPTRILTGWAYARAGRRSAPRHWFFRWTGRLAMIPVAALYVMVVFFSQYAAWEGILSLYEQHAFLVPVPFMGG
jgi:hypothetical protein